MPTGCAYTLYAAIDMSPPLDQHQDLVAPAADRGLGDGIAGGHIGGLHRRGTPAYLRAERRRLE